MDGSEGVVPPDSVGVALGDGKFPPPSLVGLDGILGSDGVVPLGSAGVAFGEGVEFGSFPLSKVGSFPLSKVGSFPLLGLGSFPLLGLGSPPGAGVGFPSSWPPAELSSSDSAVSVDSSSPFEDSSVSLLSENPFHCHRSHQLIYPYRFRRHHCCCRL
jgi:hypothetical protein